MNPAYDYDDIDDYLHDRMSAADREAFEQALQSDPALVQQVEAFKAQEQTLQLLHDEYLLEQFEAWDKEEEEKKTATGAKIMGGRWFWLIPAAAAVTFVIAGIALDWFKTQPADQEIVSVETPKPLDSTISPTAPVDEPEQFADKPHTTPLPVQQPAKSPNKSSSRYAALDQLAYRDQDFKGTLMGDVQEDTRTNYTEAVKLYSEDNYAGALQLLQQPDSAQLQQYLYLRAYTYYHLNRFAEAENDFRTFRNFRFAPHKYDAQWGEVFSLVKQLPEAGARERLETILQEMSREGHPYRERAQALVEAWKKADGK